MKEKFQDIFNQIKNLSLSELIINNEKAVVDILLTDSRNLSRPETSLFFAIRNPEGNDGHSFMSELYEKGVRNFVVEYIPENFRKYNDVNIALAKDSIDILQKIGSYFGHHDNVETVAITGSRGKTTLKELLFQLLEPLKKISRSPRSYNSRIGVPISLWQIDKNADIALIEAGISKAGEMKKLSEMIKPQTVIITNVGIEHASGFSDFNEKLKEKALLASGKEVKDIIFNADIPGLQKELSRFKGKNLFGWSLKDPDADLYLTIKEKKNDSAVILIKYGQSQFELSVNCLSNYEFENIAAAVSFMLHERLDEDTIKERFLRIKNTGTRLNVSEGRFGSIIIEDSYLSDINSLAPAIDFLKRRQTPGQKSVLIMSDPMTEPGDEENYIKKIAETVRNRKIDKFIGIGKLFSEYKEYFPESSEIFKDTDIFLKEKNASDFVSSIILIEGKGTPGFGQISEMLEARSHETLLEVNLDAIVDNYRYFRSFIPSGVGVIAMVKASGYGAGSYEIAKTLQDAGASFLAVAVSDEGADLRKNGITMPIMVMNPKASNYDALFEENLEPEIYSFELIDEILLEALKRGKKDFPVHIKLDTGMHRLGFGENDLPQLIKILKNSSPLKVSSLFSHLATADCPDMDDYTNLQLNLFEKLTDQIIDSLGYKIKRHILNSAGIIRFSKHHYDYVRLGIGLYGANTLPPEIEKPLSVVSTLKSDIISIKEYKAGETIGYGRKGLLKRDSKIATIPIGYADGINRKLGNGRISMKIKGHDAPTIGNICMDACMIDVTGIDCKIGDTVEIFGQEAPLSRLSDALETIPYEILTSVSPRVKRVYYRE